MKRTNLFLCPLAFPALALLSLGILLGCGSKPEPAGDAAFKKDLETLQGVWTVVSMEQDGEPLAADRLSKITLTIKGENFTFDTGDDSHDGLYKIDPSKDPKELNIEITRGDEKGKVYLVIYKFEDGKMIQCMQVSNKERPKEFTGKAGSGNLFEVWQRKN